MEPFSQTLELFPVEHITVLTGASESHQPLSGIHPHPIEEEKARQLNQVFGAIATGGQAVEENNHDTLED
jgi:hypothetical protein